MTISSSRIAVLVAAIVAAGLGMVLLTAANDANAGSGDVQRCQGKKETVAGNTGTNGPDVMVGTGQQDEIDGRGGDDLICSRGANDEVVAGGGDDRVRAGSGRDFVNGENGNDELFGNGGNDQPYNDRAEQRRGLFVGIAGGEGNDLVAGGSGNDQVAGQNGTDHHNGGEGSDGCFDEEQDSTFNGCEYGSVQKG